MLVHICCSVDSHYFLKKVKEQYPDEKLVGFFYNPNIHPKEEYDLRLSDVKRSCDLLGVELLVGEYDIKNWFDGVVGLESEPEKGKRCNQCFDIRLVRSAIEAKKHNETSFTTTLLSSPMKEQNILFDQGEKIGRDYGLEFIKIDTRSSGGTQEQTQLAKKDNLYRQNYCGCIFALAQQRDKQGKKSLEMMSDIYGNNQTGSISKRQEEFAKRDYFEKENIPYVLVQRKTLVYRNLSCLLQNQNGVIPSYALINSQSKKKIKIGEILWIKPKLELEDSIYQDYLKSDIKIGFSKKEDSIFVPLDWINLILKKNFSTLLDLKQNALSLEDEFYLRKILCGSQSINPIFLVNSIFEAPVTLELQSLFQEESVFSVVEFL
ncbi:MULTISPECIES: epoxyqueuosine reductase QueH [unclassified Helicobacter]|uniref:epoxyqueuosine reductase QueH n=1 Tax=unclassified Helicobacter TaxID=2593540 RepID=UPI000CF0B64D|nr:MULTISPECIES: epoxyqueuosine reductase QueH [unclassified Helicobacter]